MHFVDQMKMFMNQISVSESNEITAYGFFNINLNLIISVSLYYCVIISLDLLEYKIEIRFYRKLMIVRFYVRIGTDVRVYVYRYWFCWLAECRRFYR